jgi:3',5'-cyclic AMP phosphodiesterase CpdA
LGLQRRRKSRCRAHAGEGRGDGERLGRQPDFIVFTGDLTHTTDDAKAARERMKRFREIVSALR